jgi:hypothetical protein
LASNASRPMAAAAETAAWCFCSCCRCVIHILRRCHQMCICGPCCCLASAGV